MMKRKGILTTLVSAVALGAAAMVGLQSGGSPSKAYAMPKSGPVVVELFTSQGCNSCPPAEAFLNDLAKRDDVIALEYHVDYWDYIGWKDPFAKAVYTERQRRYAREFESRYVYTPQMVIDGMAHEVGSRRSAVEARIETASMQRKLDAGDQPPMVTMTGEASGDMQVTVSGAPNVDKSYNVMLVAFDREHITEVRSGENAGKKLRNSHVVRRMAKLGEWSGDAVTYKIDPVLLEGDGGCAIIVQDGQAGQIIAANMMRF